MFALSAKNLKRTYSVPMLEVRNCRTVSYHGYLNSYKIVSIFDWLFAAKKYIATCEIEVGRGRESEKEREDYREREREKAQYFPCLKLTDT